MFFSILDTLVDDNSTVLRKFGLVPKIPIIIVDEWVHVD